MFVSGFMVNPKEPGSSTPIVNSINTQSIRFCGKSFEEKDNNWL